MIQQTKFLHQLQKGIQMEIIKPSIQIILTKSELSAVIDEALSDASASTAIKKILNPFLTNSFPHFPTFTEITLGETLQDGTTVVTLKQPKPVTEKVKTEKVKTEKIKTEKVKTTGLDKSIESIEPLVIDSLNVETPYIEPTI